MEGDKRYLKAAAIFAIALGLATGFAHIKIESKVDAYNKEIAGYNLEITKITEFKASHKDIDRDMTELAKRHYRVAAMFPNRIDAKKTVEFLREFAQETGLYLLDVKADKERLNEDKKTYEQRFTVKVRGEYFNILDFLSELSINEDFYDIKRMNLKNDDGEITMELEIDCYCAKGEEDETKKSH